MKLFIDTNVWLRFILGEGNLYQHCVSLFEKIEKGQIKPYASTIVLLEIHFVLTKLYRIPSKQVIADIETMLKTRNVTLIEKTYFHKALHYYKKYNIKLADCLIASQLPKNTALCTFDHELKKISEIKVIIPPVD